MIKGKYFLVENETNVFQIYENDVNQNPHYQSTVMTDQNFTKKQSICVGSLAEQSKSCLPLRSYHMIQDLELKMYDQTLSIAFSDTKDKCCWRCSHEIKIVSPKKFGIGTIVKMNTCSLSCSKQICAEIRDNNDKVIFTLTSKCCQLGNFIPNFCGFLRCNSPILYEIEDSSGNVIGKIENKVKNKCGFLRSFQLDIEIDTHEVKKKILLINAIVILL